MVSVWANTSSLKEAVPGRIRELDEKGLNTPINKAITKNKINPNPARAKDGKAVTAFFTAIKVVHITFTRVSLTVTAVVFASFASFTLRLCLAMFNWRICLAYFFSLNELGAGDE